MDLGARIRGIVRGAALGGLAGVLWFAVELLVGHAAGSVVPVAVLRQIGLLDVAVGAGAGAVLGVLLPHAGLATLALCLSAAYGLLRIFAPPGYGAETVFLVTAVAAVLVGRRLVGRDADGWLGFVHIALLGCLALMGAELALSEARAHALRGMRLPVAIALLPLLPLLADRIVAVALRARGRRLALELTLVVLAALVWGRPLDPRPLEERTVTAVPPPAGTPDIILVSLDTTRADHLSLYGYGRDTSPQLKAFANEALVFDQARSAAGWTLPGHASMLTGMYPSRHGAHLAGGWLSGQSIDGRRNVAYPLAADKVTLAEVLRDRGYSTGAFVANFSYLYRDFGLAQGFQHYDDAPGLLLRVKPPVVRFAQRFSPGFCLKPYRTAHEINAAALSWLDAAPQGRPSFLFLNYMEPHQPWLAPPPHDQWVWALSKARTLVQRDLYTHEVKNFTGDELEFIVANYDGQVAAMDEAFGELLAALRSRGRYQNTLVIVTGDHGELLGEHGQVGHMGRMLYEGLLHVPMIVKYPGAEPRRGRSQNPVQVVDVLPTALQAAGAPLPPAVQGQPLAEVTRPSFAEEDINPYLVAEYGAFYDRAVRVLYDGDWKLISTSRGEKMLYDLRHDPGEHKDMAAAEPARLEELARHLEAKLSTMVATAEHPQQVN